MTKYRREQEEEKEYLCQLYSSDTDTRGFRVPVRIAKKWLLENKSFILRGNVHYLAIKNLGLGICEVRRRPVGRINTFIVNAWDVLSK